MNQNAYDIVKYMIIHLLLFLFKNCVIKWLLNLLDTSKNCKNEFEIKKKKLNLMKEEIREISPSNEYARYAKMERQINNLNDEIKQIESSLFYKNSNLYFLNTSNSDNNKNIFYKIMNSFIFKFFMYFINLIEYFVLKNEYLEVDYENNKNNIIVNYFYNKEKNKYYTLIPVYRILISETIVLNTLYNSVKNYLIK